MIDTKYPKYMMPLIEILKTKTSDPRFLNFLASNRGRDKVKIMYQIEAAFKAKLGITTEPTDWTLINIDESAITELISEIHEIITPWEKSL